MEFYLVAGAIAAAFVGGIWMRNHMATVADTSAAKAVAAVSSATTAATKMPAGTPQPIVIAAADLDAAVQRVLKSLQPTQVAPAAPAVTVTTAAPAPHA